MAFAHIRFSFWAPALLCLGLVFGSAAPSCAQIYFPWDQPPPPRRMPEARISPRMARGILAREGLQMIGQPRLRGDEIVAVGVDPEGQRQRVTLDAISGEVLEVIEIGPSARRQRLNDDRQRERLEETSPPDRPMPPPVHPAVDEAPNAAPPPSRGKAEATRPPKPAEPTQKADVQKPAPKPDTADDALSPIRPIRPAGAPKVEPLPQ